MTEIFQTRERAFENRFAHDEEIRFKTEARCCWHVGLWAAGELGLDGEDAETYARKLVEVNLEEPGFDDVKRRIRGDFDERGVTVSDHMIDVQIDTALRNVEENK